jgi:hypothetical protein
MPIGQLPQSFRGYVGLGIESTYGTGVDPQVFVDATSDGFSLDNQPEFQNTTRSQATHKGEAGAFSDEGSVDLPANPENGMGYLLAAVMGAETTNVIDPDNDSTDEVGEHVFTPSDTLPSLSAEVDRDTDVVRHVGGGVDTFELSHTAEEMLTASADIIAKEPDPKPYESSTQPTPTYSDLRNFRWNDITLSVNGTNRDTDIQEATFTVERNLSTNFRGERTLSKIEQGERVFSITATLDFEDRDLFNQFLGAADASGVQDQLAEIGIDGTWTTPETIADTSTGYALRWNQPRNVINTHEANIDQNSAVAEDVEFRGLFDPSIGGEAEITLTNGILDAYASA